MVPQQTIDIRSSFLDYQGIIIPLISTYLLIADGEDNEKLDIQGVVETYH